MIFLPRVEQFWIFGNGLPKTEWSGVGVPDDVEQVGAADGFEGWSRVGVWPDSGDGFKVEGADVDPEKWIDLLKWTNDQFCYEIYISYLLKMIKWLECF